MITGESPKRSLPAAAVVFAWFLATALCVMAVGGLLQNSPVWRAGTGRATALLMLSLAYLAGGVVIVVTHALRRPVTIPDAVRTMLAGFGLVLFGILLADVSFSRKTMVLVCGLSVALTIVPFIVPRRATIVGALLALLATGPAALASSRPESLRTTVSRLLPTSLYTLRLTIHYGAVETDSISGGGLAVLDDRILIATGAGRIYVGRRDGGEVKVTQAALRIPLDDELFRAAAEGTTVPTHFFRVAGFAVQSIGVDSIRVLASHHVWRDAERCFVLRLSEVTGHPDSLLSLGAVSWRRVFDSSPCLPMKSRGRLFNGSRAGGRILVLNDTTVLLSVGDHEFDGVNSTEALPQDSAASYGKLLAIDLTRGTSRSYSIGHRNPQGLAARGDGSIWSTEHGPRGGDELNQIRLAGNYGWPIETYGTNYGSHFWPLSDTQGQHSRFVPPVFAWVPSVGISSLIEARGEQFPLWEGDLLVGSLVGKTVYRIRIEDHRVRLSEPIPVGERVRDVVQATDGTIILWLDGGAIGVLAPAEAGGDAGARAFTSQCGSCHILYDGKSHGVGPDLAGIVGRRIASASGYPYSAALARVRGRWSASRLDALMRDGQRFAPGTTMPDVVVSDSATRAAIVRYLVSQE